VATFTAFDVYDAEGNRLTTEITLMAAPDDQVIRALAARWRLARTVLVAPSDDGWRVVHVGREVSVALAAAWWPL
jgi:hypothetical protein